MLLTMNGKSQQKKVDPFTSSELASASPSGKVSDQMKMTKEEMLRAFEGKGQVNKLRKPLNCPMDKDKPCACLLQNISSRDCPYGKRKQTPITKIRTPTSPQGKTTAIQMFRSKSPFPVGERSPEQQQGRNTTTTGTAGKTPTTTTGGTNDRRELILKLLEAMRKTGVTNCHKQMPTGKEREKVMKAEEEKKKKKEQ